MGTVVHADEAASWDNLRERFEIKRINHLEAYSLDGACANMAEEYFSRLRRAEIGIHHHIAGAYLLRYAQESSWREDNRRVSNGDQVNRIATLALNNRAADAYRLPLTIGRHVMTGSQGISRRQALIIAAGAAGASATGAVAIIGTSSPAQAAKVSQKIVNYQDTPKGEQRCENCVQFEAPSTCKTVDGTVSAQGWCSVYAKKQA
jgi:hypothetical protein